jgi:hypothetical protein
MNGASLAANTSVNFILTNSLLTSADMLVLNITAGTTNYGSYFTQVSDVQNGLAVITLRNVGTTALAETVVIAFIVIKAAAN